MNKNSAAFSIKLPKKNAARLKSAALLYGISPDAMARRVIADATRALLEMPQESLDEYENKEEIVSALQEGVREYRRGIFLRQIPKKTLRVL